MERNARGNMSGRECRIPTCYATLAEAGRPSYISRNVTAARSTFHTPVIRLIRSHVTQRTRWSTVARVGSRTTHDYQTQQCTSLSRPVWLSGIALIVINAVALRRTRLIPGWVTVLGRVNHLDAEQATQIYSAWSSLIRSHVT